MPKLQIDILPGTWHATHILKLLNKMYKYEMAPIRTVGTTERIWDARRTDGWTDWQMDERSETNIQLRCAAGINDSWDALQQILPRSLLCYV